MEARTYFQTRGSGLPPKPRGQCSRIAHALYRGNVNTMAQLCAMSEGELLRVRDIGPTALLIILMERQVFQENNAGTQDTSKGGTPFGGEAQPLRHGQSPPQKEETK